MQSYLSLSHVSGVRICLLLGSIALSPVHVGAQVPRSVTLRELLDSVAANHPTVQASEARIRAARGARISAGAFGNPMLAYQVDNTPFPGGRSLSSDREAMTMATLPLESFYQRGSRVRRANAEVGMSEAMAHQERQQLALDAVHTYYRSALAQVTVDASRDLTAWLDTLVAYNRARTKEGVAAEAELIRSELERDRAAAELSIDEAYLAKASADLASFLSSSSIDGRRLTASVPTEPLPIDVAGQVQTLINASLPRRPDLKAAEQRVAAAKAGVSVERSMFVRDLGATLGVKQMDGMNSMIIGVSLPLPLFDRNRGEVTRASAEKEVATAEWAAQLRTARAEITGAVESARLLTEQAEALKGGYLARADEARRISLAAYKESAVPLLQVLDAARAWNEARVTYYRLLLAQHESVIELNAAQGFDLLSSSNAVSPSLSR